MFYGALTNKLTYEELEDKVRELEKEVVDRKQAVNELKIFSEALENSTDAIGMSTPQGHHYYQNKAFDRLFGKIGEYPPDIVYVDKKIGEEIFKTIMSGGTWTGEVKMYEKNGPVLDIDLRAYANKDEDGNIISLVGVHTDITERKKAEEKLKETKVILQAAMDSSPAAIAIADSPDGKLRYVNKAGLLIRGGSEEELVKDVDIDKYASSWQILHFDGTEYKKDEVPLARAIMYGETCNEEFIIKRDDGEKRICWANAAPIFDDEGNVKFGIVVFLDITERKQAEERLQRIEVIMNTTQQLTKIGGWEYDLKEQVHFWTDQMYRIYDFEPGDLRPDIEEHLQRSMECYDHEDLLVIIEAMQKCTEEGQSYDFEFPFTTTKGRRIWIRTITEAVFEGDRIVKVVGSLMDITERKQSEEKLRESENLLSKTQKYANIGSWMFDLNTGRRVWSEQLYHIYGRDIDKGVPPIEVLFETYHPDDRKQLQEVLNSMITKGEPFRIEFSIFRENDGEQRWLRSQGELEKNENGEPYRLIGMAQDITERKKMETAKTKLEEQLRQSQKMEAIGTLAGGIAHDFNNILGIIVGNTELAIDNVLEWNPVRYNLEEISKASLRARDMVRQILSFSRQTIQEAKPIRISPIIEESLKLLRSSFPATIEIRHNFSTHADTIHADSTQINQILMNLCTNATHAMQEGGGIMEVGLKNIDLDENDMAHYKDLTPGKYIVLTVSDTGHGIESDIVGRIFDPYFTTKNVGEGTGMGLSVVHGLVTNHGGTIHVYSEPGKGTTFKVLFPLIENITVLKSTSHEPLLTGTERILFVDDEEALADLGKKILQNLGYDVTVRTSSIEALEAFKAQPEEYDLLLTDMTMPNMTGKELAKKLLGIRPDFPIILCTGFSEMVTEDKAKQMGIKAFVMKPLVMREIAETIRQVLGQKEE